MGRWFEEACMGLEVGVLVYRGRNRNETAEVISTFKYDGELWVVLSTYGHPTLTLGKYLEVVQ